MWFLGFCLSKQTKKIQIIKFYIPLSLPPTNLFPALHVWYWLMFTKIIFPVSPSETDTSDNRHLLKAIGNTSRLLTESITERVSTRTKDAKQKIDQIQKSSRDRLAETTKSATNKLKSVRKNLHSTLEMTQNLSLGRKKNNVTSKKDGKSPEAVFHLDRVQSVPVNDELFSSISFNSPLNSKTNKCSNINTAESSYEIPKSIRSFSSDSSGLNEIAVNKQLPSIPPPTYDEVLLEDEKANNDRPNPMSRNRRKSKTNSNVYENHEIIVPKIKVESDSKSNSSEEDDGYSMPCPNFPAPVLEVKEGIYGKIRSKDPDDSTDDAIASTSMQPPTRSRRRKENGQPEGKEEIDGINSNRATADSKEFPLEGKYANLLGGELSEDLSEKLKLDESKISKPSRSESWSYYDGNSDVSSSPEPIYENERDLKSKMAATSEPLYGVLYNSESSNMLTPVAAARKRRSQGDTSDQYAVVNKSPELRLRNVNETKDILKEFDPLDRRTLDKILASKSNELKLLESILGSETYGNCADESNYEYHSNETSDGDDTEEVPTPPERLDSLKECANEDAEESGEGSPKKDQNDLSSETRRSVIIHQNVKLRSDSDENIAEDANIASGSNVMEESVEKTSNTRWFFSTPLKTKSDRKSSNPQKNKDEKTCVEEIAEVLEDKSMTPITKTSSMKSMFSNVMNKVEGIKRKTSFRSNTNKNEVKTVLEMIPRPCLTQRLILHEGHLIRLPTGVVEDILKELHSRKAYIRDKRFQAYCDKDLKTPKENIPLETITTIQCVHNHKFTHNFVDIYCFEITTSITKKDGNNLSNANMVITSNNSGNIKAQRICHLYGVAKESERFLWMQKLLESLTDTFPPGFTSKFYRAGWCYSKVSRVFCHNN